MLSVEGRRKGGDRRTDRERERRGDFTSQREVQTRQTGISKNVLRRRRDVNRQEMGKVTCGMMVINENDHFHYNARSALYLDSSLLYPFTGRRKSGLIQVNAFSLSREMYRDAERPSSI